MLEMTKFVPQVLRQFHLEWASPKDEWEISGYFFAKQKGVIMRFTARDKSSQRGTRHVKKDSDDLTGRMLVSRPDTS